MSCRRFKVRICLLRNFRKLTARLLELVGGQVQHPSVRAPQTSPAPRSARGQRS